MTSGAPWKKEAAREWRARHYTMPDGGFARDRVCDLIESAYLAGIEKAQRRAWEEKAKKAAVRRRKT